MSATNDPTAPEPTTATTPLASAAAHPAADSDSSNTNMETDLTLLPDLSSQDVTFDGGDFMEDDTGVQPDYSFTEDLTLGTNSPPNFLSPQPLSMGMQSSLTTSDQAGSGSFLSSPGLAPIRSPHQRSSQNEGDELPSLDLNGSAAPSSTTNLLSPPLTSTSSKASRARSTRDGSGDSDDSAVADDEDEEFSNPRRKKQRRSSTHPPPPSMSPTTIAAAAAASIPATSSTTATATNGAHSQEEEYDSDDSEDDDEEESEEEESDESDYDTPAGAGPSARPFQPSATSSSTSTNGLPPRVPRIPSNADIILLDDDDNVPNLEHDPSSFFGGDLPELDTSANGSQEGVIDLTADEPNNPFLTFDPSNFLPTPSPTASAAAAANYAANRQSITASLFSKPDLLPTSQFNPFPSNGPVKASPFPTSNNTLLPPSKIQVKAEPAEKPSKTVDLRANSDDDEASDNKFGTILCPVFGLHLCQGRAQPKEIVVLTRVKTGADANAIRVDNIIHQPCGVLNKDVASALSPLIDAGLVRVEAKVGTYKPGTPTQQAEMGLRIDLHGKNSDRKTVEKHLRRTPQVTYLSVYDPIMPKKPPPPTPATFLQMNDSASIPNGQPTYVNEFGQTVVGFAPPGNGVSVREIENDLDSLFGNEIDLATMPLAETPACLRTHLHPYQRQGLAWMIQHEQFRTMNIEGKSELMMGWSKQVDAEGHVTFFNKLTKEVQNEPPELARGGLLADEMGLGKTLQVLSLIATTLKQNVGADGSAAASSNKLTLSLKTKVLNPKRIAPTLIVCPLSVITNWEQQILHHFNPNQMLSFYTYHGPNRLKDVTQLRQYDILITTYTILSQEYDISCAALGLDASSESDSDDDTFKSLKKKVKKKKNKKKIDAAQAAAAAAASAAYLASEDTEAPELRRAPLFDIDFFRIILDEAHVIRERNTLQSRAARALRGERRWALSGTPLVNKVDDAFALLNFIKVPPFSSYTMWQRIVLKPMKARDPNGMKRLQQIMSTICLRRRKNEEINGKRILILPEKTQRTRQLELIGKEKALYDTLAETGRKQFNKLVKDGSVLSHYAYVLEILLRMRQATCHSMLVPQHYHSHGFSDLVGHEDKKAEIMRLVSLLEEGLADECGICHKVVDDPVITQCAHYMCRACMDTYLANPAYYNAIYVASFQTPEQQHQIQPIADPTIYCGQCRAVLDKSLIVSMHHKELLRLEQEQQQAAVLHSKGHVTLSPKLLALLEELQIVLNKNDKAVIFSQWTSFLNILQSCLNQANVKHVRLDGQMNAANRAKALKAFEDDDSVKVFLISLKAGGVGLNLTAANHVFMMDPWWAPAIEDQAIDRVHRLGQTKDVEVVRFIVKDSVEEKIMELQDAKRQMTTSALTRASKSREDQQADRLQDLQLLFK